MTATAEVIDVGRLTPHDRLYLRRCARRLPQWRAAALLGVSPALLSLAEAGRMDEARTAALDARLAELLNAHGGGVPPTA